MTAQPLDGKDLQRTILSQLASTTSNRPADLPPPGLLLITCNEEPATLSYLRMNQRAAEMAGVTLLHERVSDQDNGSHILKTIEAGNAMTEVHSIVVQQPLTCTLTDHRRFFLNKIRHTKDTEGMGSIQIANRLHDDPSAYFPCTAQACLAIINHWGLDWSKMNVAILGNSPVVGQPLDALLRQRIFRQTTVCDITTPRNTVEAACLHANLIISAVGKPDVVTEYMVGKNRPHLIDVGINYIPDPASPTGHRLVGDMSPAAYAKSSRYTPVPGGVGPVTIATVMSSVVEAWQRQLQHHALGYSLPG